MTIFDPDLRRTEFPALTEMTYLNTAAEGIPPRAVGDALARYFHDKQRGSPGRDQHFAVWEQVRRLTAGLYGLDSDEIGLCSNSSEAYNLLSLALNLGAQDEVVLNDLDFPAGRTPWLQTASQAGIRCWRARDGALRVEDLAALLGPRTRLVTVSLVSYFNGCRVSVPEIAQAVREHSPALLAVDVTQALGRIPLDLCGADFIVSSTHKWILASHGGGLVGVPRARADELTTPAGGWFNLQDAFEGDPLRRFESKPGAASYMAGMPNFPALYAIGAALDAITTADVAAIEAQARPLIEGCRRGLEGLPVEIITPDGESPPAGILAFRCERMDEVAARLEAERVIVMHSAGRLRVALHAYNTEADVERFLSVLSTVLR